MADAGASGDESPPLIFPEEEDDEEERGWGAPEACAERLQTPPLEREAPSPAIDAFGHFVQCRWAASVVAQWLGRRFMFNGFLLTGEAGVGKSTVLMRIRDLMGPERYTACMCLTATTHVAASLLDPECGRTYQSALGIDLEMCRSRDIYEFAMSYKHKHRDLLLFSEELSCAVRAAALCRSAAHGHVEYCSRCIHCVGAAREILIKRNIRFPPMFLRSLIVIDEYGLLSSQDLLKVMWVLNVTQIAGQPRSLLLAGSVSQLQPPTPGLSRTGLWNSRLLLDREGLFDTRMQLTVNFRQATDPGYGRSLSLLQFNLASTETVRVLDSRVVGLRAEDPDFQPQATRIFNSNARRQAFIEKTRALRPSSQEIRLEAVFTEEPVRPEEQASFRDFASRLRQAYPKVFTERIGVRPRGGKLSLSPCLLNTVVNVRDRRGYRSGLLRARTCDFLQVAEERVPLATFRFGGHAAVFFPVWNAWAANTFSAQGATIAHGGVVYCPPISYMRSPIKASAYVALSRVPSRDQIWLSSNPFPHAGSYPLFTSDVLHYRKTVELGFHRPQNTSEAAASTRHADHARTDTTDEGRSV